MNLRYMDRDTTTAIKGIALIFMFIHHFYNFPEFYIEGISFPWVESFTNLTYALLKMCVALFAFLTGYFYAFNSQRTWRYSFRKISDLYVCYWLVYLPMLLFAVLTGCYEFSLYSFAFELAGLKLPFMVFCWYIEFYCCTMLLLQLLAHRENNPVEDILWLLILPVVLTSVLSGMYLEGFLNGVILHIRDWFPSVVSGFLCAKYGIFEKLFERNVSRCRNTLGKIFIWVSMLATAAVGRYWWSYLYFGSMYLRSGEYPIMLSSDFFLVPLFVYGAARLLQYIRNTSVMKFLQQLGKYSLHMWFLHCIFFNVCNSITQPVLYWPKNPVLVVLWGLLLCYVPAVLLDKLIAPANKLKNRFL